MELKLYGGKIWLAKTPVDFRKSIDGLSQLVVDDFKKSPVEGIFLFYNKGKDKIKCLSWHKNGFVLIYKRLEKGKFQFLFNRAKGSVEIDLRQLSWLLAGLPWQSMSNWRELDYKTFS